MSYLYSETDDKRFSVSSQETILESSLKAGIEHTHVCGGKARCSTCRVEVIEGLSHCLPRNEAEQAMGSRLGLPETIRLACQTRVNGDVKIRRLAVDDLDARIIKDQLTGQNDNSMGREKEVAVLFTDLANYTEFAESLPAYDVVHVLNRYYQTMNAIVTEHGGVISDVAGDGMLILFGACKKEHGLVLDAVHTVRAMHKELDRFNEYLMSMYGRSFGLRAGINHGPAIIGHFSTGPMSKVAAIGDTVNLASRIEQANKAFGSQLLISESAYQHIKGDIEISASHQTHLKGKTGLYDLYEVQI
ncbi:adenylate/guanylate cyclase domain-containing protein [Mariprofundus micogutta]|uniref:adenylate/guanylate cyclase domain-containing protein n=1 Tax=Mariprofundus micogutta TaxID=1921010 RepID=UPI0009348344|nr:adenylate/guanylate cyclase domain-containing protein [Mariprofundus micogutta]